jgi:hypothetical protein
MGITVEAELHSFLTLHGICQLLDTSPTTPKGKSTSWYQMAMMLATPMLTLMLWGREIYFLLLRNNSLVVQAIA